MFVPTVPLCAPQGHGPFVDMPPHSPAVSSVFVEMDALNRALLVIDEGVGTAEEARKLIRSAADSQPSPEDVSGFAILTAMRHVLGLAQDPPPQAPIPIERHLSEAVALAWVGWIRGEPVALERAKALLDVSEQLGAMEAMALRYWVDAMEAERTDEGRRLWKRALEVSSSFGAESHPVLQWAYVATWLGTPPVTAP